MNRASFFNVIRENLGRQLDGDPDKDLSVEQVSGLTFLLDRFEADARLTDVRWKANMLAQAWHETAYRMQPILEYGDAAYFNKRYGPGTKVGKVLGNDKAVALGISKPGAWFRGRGYIQITGYTNYKKFADLLGIDLVMEPDLALEPDNAYEILVQGMVGGLFTGVGLPKFFNDIFDDPRRARRIVNGMDKADTIAGYHRIFLEAFNAAAD